MNNTRRTLILLALAAGLGTTPAAAFQDFAPEIGYVTTSESVYGSGLVYGATIMEGTGRFGLGLSYMRLGNSWFYEHRVKVGPDSVFRYQEDYVDSYVSILGTWMHGKSPKEQFIAGIGPQIHFLSATKHSVVQGSVESARDSRLGIGALVRYRHRIEMFGSMSLVVAAWFSWMESGVEMLDVYTPPAEGMTSAAITVGLAFPF